MSQSAWLDVLRAEFDAEPGSFLLALRTDLRWDEDAYDRLTSAMTACCAAVQGQVTVERWLAEGFWYLSWFPRNWTGHDSWVAVGPRPSLLERFDNLAHWFFVGEPVRQ